MNSNGMTSSLTKIVHPLAEYSLVWSCLSNRICHLSKRNVQIILLSLSLDLVLGWIIFTSLSPIVQLDDAVYIVMDRTVEQLQLLLTWLKDNPAGLKLNSVLSQALANFFLYHIHLWVTYVVLVLPLLLPLSSVLPMISLSLQIAVLGDLFSVLTIHIHCFYAYARRLAWSMYKGLVSLWRLFIGKKYNPLRDRVDSANCTVEQLFLGTILFTILLFLLPTSLTFFTVFASLKLVAVAVNFTLRNIIKAIQWLPT